DQVLAGMGKLSRAELEGYAKAAGLDVARFRAALDDRRFHDAVVAEGASAEALGVEATPTLFVNGQPLVGARDEANLDRVIAIHLDHAKEHVQRGLKRGELYPTLMSMAKGEERADPAAIPESLHVEMRSDDRARAVAAACRRHDGTRAEQLAGALAGDAQQRASAGCAGGGI